MTQNSGYSDTRVGSGQNFRAKSLSNVIEVNENIKSTAVFNVNLDDNEDKDNESENLSDSNSHNSDSNKPQELI